MIFVVAVFLVCLLLLVLWGCSIHQPASPRIYTQEQMDKAIEQTESALRAFDQMKLANDKNEKTIKNLMELLKVCQTKQKI